MRILQICAAYKPAFVYGGPTMSVSMLSEQLAVAGTTLEVYTTTANGKSELQVATDRPVSVDGVTVTYFPRITGDHSHLSPVLLKQLWKQVPNFSLVHIHAWWNLVSVFSCLIALMRNVPVIVSARGTLSPYSFQNKNIGVKWAIHNLLGKPMLNRCHIHVTSQREYEAIAKLIRPKSITILPNFVKLAAQKSFAESTPSPVFKLIFFSRIEEKKGLDILLNALSLVTLPWSLTIAGDGDEDYIEKLKEIATSNRIDDKINWSGFHSEDKFDLLAAHDLFVLPSHDENFGNAVIESLSVGTPVLVSEQVGLVDYVVEKKLGWVCKTNPVSVSSMINQIAGNCKADLERIRRDAVGIIDDDFNENNLVKKYIHMYNQISENGRI